ncbi:MAG: hypothetical protein NTV98_01895 [Candidatus Roizmanbacteria bacterium]|nr:hypothetical protein [Candidatus Roizmanbacteria bacterium]
MGESEELAKQTPEQKANDNLEIYGKMEYQSQHWEDVDILASTRKQEKEGEELIKAQGVIRQSQNDEAAKIQALQSEKRKAANIVAKVKPPGKIRQILNKAGELRDRFFDSIIR